MKALQCHPDQVGVVPASLLLLDYVVALTGMQ